MGTVYRAIQYCPIVASHKDCVSGLFWTAVPVTCMPGVLFALSVKAERRCTHL